MRCRELGSSRIKLICMAMAYSISNLGSGYFLMSLVGIGLAV